MQKVLTAAEMREVDRLTTERYGIPSIILMENAAHAVAKVITEKLGGSVKGKLILILCGKGNNGGDGAALARLLWKDGAHVCPLLFGRIDDITGDARTNLDILAGIDKDVATSGGEFNKLIVHQDDEDLIPLLEGMLSSERVDIVVDAMYGTGLTRELSGIYTEVIQRLENHAPNILSIDLPSGLDADRGYPLKANVSASTTVTFTAPKPANVIAPGSRFNGELVVANIGSPQWLIDEQASQLFLPERWDVAHWFAKSKFFDDSYKNKRGHALIVAGSENYSGAAVLCGNSAIRSGVGLVTVATPRSSKESIAGRVVPEVMVRPVAETESGAVSEDAIAEVEEFLENIDAIAIGAGLSASSESTGRFVRHFVENRRMPTILDADALTLISPFGGEALAHARASDNEEALAHARASDTGAEEALAYAQASDNKETLAYARVSDSEFPLIVTPHEGEFMRMLGTEDKDAIKDRVGAVREFAQKHNVILVLKGERVLIGEPGGKVVVNPTGNAGLGKAGNGDTLLGILAGFVAQAAKMKIDIFETVVAAVYVAGMAGDIAEKKYGKRVMTASDVRDCLVDVFAEFEKE
jgi:ADP-dependent NAD(P)H-hydrate dehydratase / NAD(P)H-hydrate epimerase